MCHFNHEQGALVGDLTSQEEGDDGEDEEAVSGGATGACQMMLDMSPCLSLVLV
jgi:hypothetical protein